MEFFLSSLAISLILGIASWRRPEAGLVGVLFLLPFYIARFSIGGVPTTLLECVVVTVIAVILYKGIKTRYAELKGYISKKGLARWVVWSLFFLFLASIVGVFVAPDLVPALGLWRAYFFEPFLFLGAFLLTIQRNEQLDLFLKSLLATGALVAVVAVYQKFTGWNIPPEWIGERRVTGLFPYPNAVGLLLAPLVPFVVHYMYRSLVVSKNHWSFLGWLGLAVLFVVSIYFAKTEAALVALFAVGMGSALLVRRTRVVAGGLLVAAALVALFFQPAQEVVGRKLMLKDWSGKVRRITWNESARMLSDNWLLGAGIGGYKSAMKPYHKATHLEIFLYPHSLFLNFWTELGLLGAVSFMSLLMGVVALLASAMKQLSDRMRKTSEGLTVWLYAHALLASVSIIAIHGLVDVPYFKNDLSILFLFLVGASLFVWKQTCTLCETS